MWLYYFTFPPAMHEHSDFFLSSHSALDSIFLITPTLVGVNCISLWFDFNFPNNVKCAFICWLDNCISSLEKHLFKCFTHFSIGSFFFLLWNVSFYTFWVQLLYQTWLEIFCLTLCAVFSLFLVVQYVAPNLLILLIYVFFVIWVFVSYHKKPLPNQISVFYSKTFIVLAHIFRHTIHFKLIIVFGVMKWYLIILSGYIQLSHSKLLKRLLFLLDSLSYLLKINWPQT